MDYNDQLVILMTINPVGTILTMFTGTIAPILQQFPGSSYKFIVNKLNIFRTLLFNIVQTGFVFLLNVIAAMIICKIH